MPWVKHKATGLVHDVSKDHFALDHEDFEVLKGKAERSSAYDQPEDLDVASSSPSTRTTRARKSSKKPARTSSA